MTVVTALAPVVRPVRSRPLVGWRGVRHQQPVVVTLSELDRATGLRRYAVAGAMVYSAAFPLLQVAVIAESPPYASYGKAAWALIATAAYLPLHLHHVAHAVRGTRPPRGSLTLAVQAVLILGAVPLAGAGWLPSLHALIVSALIVLRPPWSWLAALAVVIAQTPLLEVAETSLLAAPSYYTLTVVWRAASVFLPVWLIGAILRLEATRQALADEAVVRERVRIDDELRRTLGSALDAIVARGERAGDLVGRDDRAAADELQTLVQGSRQALADARQLVSGYQQPSLRAEVDTAAGLLDAAGLPTRVEWPEGDLPDTIDDAVRSALRSATARLLRDGAVGGCAIVVTNDAGRVQLALKPEDASPSPVGAGR